MKALFLLCACVLRLTVAAQPDFNRNYCGFAPNDSIDLTNDGIPDLVVLGFRTGTDDEPSSSGNCHLHVMNLPGTTLLHTKDAQGYWRVKHFNAGERVAAIDTTLQDDLRIPTIHSTDGSIQVAYWGYGGQAEKFTVTPNLSDQYYVFRTMANGRTWHGSFTIEPPVQMDQVNVRVGELLPTDQPFVVR
jgi:hypothetical protein